MRIPTSFTLCLILINSVRLTASLLDIDLNLPAHEDEEGHILYHPEQHQPQQVQHVTNTCTKFHEPGCGHWEDLTPYQRRRNSQKKYYRNMPKEKKLARSQRGKEVLTEEQKERYRLTTMMKEQKHKEQGKSYYLDLRQRKRKGEQVRVYEKMSDFWQNQNKVKRIKTMSDNDQHNQ